MSDHLASYESTPVPGIKALLLSGNALTKKYTLASGENRTRGAVLGRVLGSATPAAAAGNTSGSGTIGAVTLGAGAKAGVYQLICIEPGSNAGVFEIEDPDGVIIGRATVAVAFSGPINFTIADATDFVAGDRFTITVALGSGVVKLAAAAATDGSATPIAILADDCDASLADTECIAYDRGDFNEDALVFGAGHTADTVRETLRARGMYLIAGA